MKVIILKLGFSPAAGTDKNPLTACQHWNHDNIHPLDLRHYRCRGQLSRSCVLNFSC